MHTNSDFLTSTLRLIEASKNDGDPFGLKLGNSKDAHILEIDDAGGASIHRVMPDGDGPILASALPAFWPRIAEVAIADFNRRIAAKSMRPGSFPAPGGRVALHPCLGRELELAMLTGGDDHPMAEQTLSAWTRLDGRDRLRLWKLVRRSVFRDHV